MVKYRGDSLSKVLNTGILKRLDLVISEKENTDKTWMHTLDVHILLFLRFQIYIHIVVGVICGKNH